MYQLSPLHVACILNDYRLVKKILKETKNPNLEDDAKVKKNSIVNEHIFILDQITPFMYACIHGHSDIVKLFLKEKRVNLVAIDKFKVCKIYYELY